MSKVHQIAGAAKPAPAKVAKTVTMTLKKSTKGTHVYENGADDAMCSQVYLTKAGMGVGETPPQTITMTVEFTA